MKTEVRIGPQVEAFVKSLAPEPRQAVRRAIKALADEQGDTKELEGKLASYRRLRVGRIRVIYVVRTIEGKRQALCFFADYRATVYAVLEQLLASGLHQELES